MSCQSTRRKGYLQVVSACVGIKIQYFSCEIKAFDEFGFECVGINFVYVDSAGRNYGFFKRPVAAYWNADILECFD